jgi:hypothetical protein
MTTASQIKGAPHGAVYICAGYEQARWLQANAHRPDMRFVGLSWLDSGSWYGVQVPAIVLDHFAYQVMSLEQRDAFTRATAACVQRIITHKTQDVV